MAKLGDLLTSGWGPVVTGAVVGTLAPVLVRLGNPGNMGICVICFTRDIAGALGLHRAGALQFLRPEVPGFILGAVLAALAFGEFRSRGGSAPVVRFVLGALSAIGGLVFLACPWRAFQRLAGGDLNALAGIAGLAAGIGAGAFFLRRGFSLGRSHPAPKAAGWVLPVSALLLLLLATGPQFGRNPDTGALTGPIFSSLKGPGAQHAPALISLGAALLVGFLAQRSRFCTVGGIRDLILIGDAHLFWGVVSFTATAFLANLALGQFHPGFANQPIAHTDGLWNFGGMFLTGLAFTLGGGCPGRQVVLSGEGDMDAGVFTIGLLFGVAMAHNLNLASSAAGVSPYGPLATLVGIALCTLLGATMREEAG